MLPIQNKVEEQIQTSLNRLFICKVCLWLFVCMCVCVCVCALNGIYQCLNCLLIRCKQNMYICLSAPLRRLVVRLQSHADDCACMYIIAVINWACGVCV